MPLLKKISGGLIALFLLVFAWFFFQEPKLITPSFFLSPLAPKEGREIVLESPEELNPDQLVLDLKNFLATQSGTWGIAVTSLNSNSQQLTTNTFGVNFNRPFPAASVMKVLVAANLINRVNKGELSLEEKIEGRTLKELTKSMINQTENEAWEILNNFLGLKKIQGFGESLGMKNLNIYKNALSANDINILLQAIYQRKTASASLTNLLLSFMQNTETEDRIPQALPLGVIVYHKAGTWPETGTYSDAAIIKAESSFILTILSEDVPTRSQATEVIRNLTKKVLTAFAKS
jgi:beta-lactamase class A